MNLTTLMKFGDEITANTPIGERVLFGLEVVAIGMGVVFGVLVLLIGILQLFKLFSVKKPAKQAKDVSAPAVAATAPAAVGTSSEEEKIVAIATAAIAASRGVGEVDFNVISINPIGKGASVATPAPAPVAETAPAPVKESAPAPAPVVAGDGEKINAPLPGTVLKVLASAGASVKKGDVLCVLEAMKMENDIVAPKDGTIVTAAATQGASVNTGDLLFVIG